MRLSCAKKKKKKKKKKTSEDSIDAGDLVTETETDDTFVLCGFKLVSTFDISQTDGEPLPKIGVDALTGDVDGYESLLEAIMRTSPVPITFESIPRAGVRGFYHHIERRIVVLQGMSELQTIKTLLHEIAHARYHAIDQGAKNSAEEKSTAQKECEAESIAYICAAHYGLDTSDYSFSYVAGWSSGKDTPELKASLQMIRRCANEMIDAIDEQVKRMQASLAA